MTTSTKLLPVHKRFDISFSRGEGVYLYSEGRKYLDFGAGIAVNALGHCHPKMVEAITNQAKNYGMFLTFITSTSSINTPKSWSIELSPIMFFSAILVPKVWNALSKQFAVIFI